MYREREVAKWFVGYERDVIETLQANMAIQNLAFVSLWN
jgi:hypothetical protein